MVDSSQPAYTRELRPARYFQREGRQVPKSTRGRIVTGVSRHRIHAVDQSDDRFEPEITGRFVAEHGYFQAFFNQAAKHFECILSMTLSGHVPGYSDHDDARLNEHVFRIAGDYDAQAGHFHVYRHPDPDDLRGTLRLEDGPNALRLQLDPEHLPADLRHLADSVLRRQDNHPTLFDHHLAHAGVPSILRTIEWFPLTPRQTAFVDTTFARHRHFCKQRGQFDPSRGHRWTLKEIFEDFAALEAPMSGFAAADTLARQNCLRSIDGCIGGMFESLAREPVPDGIHASQFIFAENMLRDYLHETTISFSGVPRTLMTLLTIMIQHDANSQYGTVDLGHVERHVGVTAPGIVDPSEELQSRDPTIVPPITRTDATYVYEATITMASRMVGPKWVRIGGKGGTLEIRQTQPFAWKEPVVCDFVLIGGEVGLSRGSSDMETSQGTATSSSMWLPEHLGGRLFAFDLGGDFGHKGGMGLAFTLLAMTGDHDSAPRGTLDFDFSGESQIVGRKHHVSIGAKSLQGVVWNKHGDLRQGDVPQRQRGFDYAEELSSADRVHFPLGDSNPNEEARRVLDVFAAAELRMLSDSKTSLVAEGFTDRVDYKHFNLELGSARCRNVLRYVGGALGSRFALEVSYYPEPELGGQRYKETDGGACKTASQFEHQGLATWFTYGEEAATVDGDADGAPNHEFRKVEITLNGMTILSLSGERRRPSG